jgi:RNA polymerase sigma factor (sigma-70 family)
MGTEDEDRRAWFYSQVLPHEAALIVYASRYCRNNSQEARDLVHETFLKLLAYADWRTVQNPAAFATITLRNLALGELKRRKIISFNSFADLDRLGLADGQPAADRVVESREELRLLAEIVKDLPPQCRRVFVLRKIQGLSHAEIGEQLGISVSTVENHLTKALRICTQRMAEQPAPGQRPFLRPSPRKSTGIEHG